MRNQKYKNSGNRGLFDEQETYQKLSSIGNPLEKIDKVIDFEYFRNILEEGVLNKDKKSNAGAKRFDVVMMFKILILQRYYGLGDTQIAYQILDRLSFKKFLGLESGDKVPDEKTVWAFREILTSKGLVEKLFNKFRNYLEERELIMNEGKMVDASFVEAPRQRNSREENKHIKETGTAPKDWDDKPNKKRQKDVDARWTKKNNTTFYGYKNHVKSDTKTKLIEEFEVTDASVHDSQVIEGLLTEKDEGQPLYADSAYTGEEQEKAYKKKKIINKVHEKGCRNQPLTEEQKVKNKEKSSTRVRVEHIFGFVENSMNGSFVRTIGIIRATAKIGMMNLTYNICRCTQLKIQVCMG